MGAGIALERRRNLRVLHAPEGTLDAAYANSRVTISHGEDGPSAARAERFDGQARWCGVQAGYAGSFAFSSSKRSASMKM